MNTNRFETFFDAILAIIITVLVLKLAQPASPTLDAILVLNARFVTYAVCFFAIFIIWYDNHNLFQVVDEIDNKVLVIYALMMFAISLLPNSIILLKASDFFKCKFTKNIAYHKSFS